MKNKLVNITLLIALLIFIALNAKTVAAQTIISSCPFNITSSGEYIVSQNLDPGGGDCIRITANDVNLTGNGSSLNNDNTGAGINATTACNNLIIRDFSNIDAFSVGVRLDSCEDSLITNNSLNGNPLALLMISAHNSNITQSTITSGGSIHTNVTTSNNVLFDQNQLSNGQQIVIDSSDNLTIQHSSQLGPLELNATTNSTFTNNSMQTTNDPPAIILNSSSTDNNFFNNSMNVNRDWIQTISSSTGNNFTNTTFTTNDGSINIIGNATILDNILINKSHLNVSSNNAFLNSTNLSFFNQSAIISFSPTRTLNSRPIVDFEDDGTFEDCSEAQCTDLVIVGSNYQFNVTSFTTYQGNESIANATQCGYVNEDVTVTDDISAGGTCYTINASNAIIDINGFTITGTGSGNFVDNTGGFDNITIRNGGLVSSFTTTVNTQNTDPVNELHVTNTSFTSSGNFELKTVSNFTFINNTINSNSISFNIQDNSNNITIANSTLRETGLNVQNIANFYLINNTINGTSSFTNMNNSLIDQN
ncbi:hypothetical protein COV18_00490, partial [Candidatus Woesearchaeota archaeon CG10_big_fil_rev_8_21_14_0_10_37_12]